MSCATYRKLPVEVEAVRVRDACDAAEKDWRGLPRWMIEAYERGEVLFVNQPRRIRVVTGHSDKPEWATGDIEDWIVRGVAGELYPCKPDIFEATFEPMPVSGNEEETG